MFCLNVAIISVTSQKEQTKCSSYVDLSNKHDNGLFNAETSACS